MRRIDEIDKAFKVDTNIERKGLTFYSALEAPFKVYGITWADGQFHRIPESVAKSTSQNVFDLHTMTAGGRLRFKTNSPFVAIKATMPYVYRWGHFALTGSSGFDLYVDNQYYRTFVPPYNMQDGYESVHDLDGKMHEILIHFPLYSKVSELLIGVQEGCELIEATPYKTELPVVYYGSSITQGGCASTPGMCYENILSRRLDCNHINLGFSGSAKGEQEIADYIAGLEMSVFVQDYDANAPSVEHLEATHEKFFLTVREKQPDLPVILAPRLYMQSTEVSKKRIEVIEKTYNNAIARGDKNVYFVPYEKLIALCGNEGTVDNTHPTDLGFMSMANAFGEVLEKIL